MRFRRLALRSGTAYLEWIKGFIRFHGKRADFSALRALELCVNYHNDPGDLVNRKVRFLEKRKKASEFGRFGDVAPTELGRIVGALFYKYASPNGFPRTLGAIKLGKATVLSNSRA
jgi:hypothetical protein